MLRVFIDSSVLIAGAGSPAGASRAVLTMAELGLFQMLADLANSETIVIPTLSL
jgi:hypothetical protein